MNRFQSFPVVNTEDLGRSKPAGEGHTVTAGEHSTSFWLFSSVDVWTSDGWLVTAVEKDFAPNQGGIHHIRKGGEVTKRFIPADEVLHYYKITAKMRHWAELKV